MASFKGTIDITGMDLFQELLAIVRGVVDDPDVPQKHKDWVQAHQTEYALDQPIEIMASHAICPLCRR